jgi:hypothetical protein
LNSVKIVEDGDDDFHSVMDKLKLFKEMYEITDTDNFNLEMCINGLESIAEGNKLSDMISSDGVVGYSVWKDASSPAGVTIEDLARFTVGEHRILNVEEFVRKSFSVFDLRERQDTKVRYEVNDDNLRISKIFAAIERNKIDLRLADYCVSQTSLEQVFNIHAAAAENQKKGRMVNTQSQSSHDPT